MGRVELTLRSRFGATLGALVAPAGTLLVAGDKLTELAVNSDEAT
jgi:hypothetical protein